MNLARFDVELCATPRRWAVKSDPQAKDLLQDLLPAFYFDKFW